MEVESKLGQTNFEEKISLIKETTLERGGHAPTVIVEGSKSPVMIQFETVPDSHEERAQMMYSVGIALAQSDRAGEIEEIWFISEGWMSKARQGSEIKLPPSQDPKRVEVLSIVRAKTIMGEYRIKGMLFEMVRDEAGHLIDLREVVSLRKDKERDIEDGEVVSPLLAVFIEGFQLGAILEDKTLH